MKALALGFLALSLASCGSSAKNLVSHTRAAANEDAGYYKAYPLTASLGSIKAIAAPAGTSGDISTEITLKYEVPCNARIETFNYDFRQGQNGKTDLLVSTIGTIYLNPNGFSCQSISLVEKKITTLGLFSADSLNLINLQGQEARVPETVPMGNTVESSFYPVGLSLVSVAPRCTGSEACPENLSVVTLKTSPVVCIDQVAPVTSASQIDGGRLELAVSAVAMRDKRLVGCANIAKTVEITVPGSFNKLSDIDLTVVGAPSP